MQIDTNGISFSPVGSSLFYKGSLLGLRYRNAILNITVKGNGNNIASFKINGEETKPFVPTTVCGNCDIEIVLA